MTGILKLMLPVNIQLNHSVNIRALQYPFHYSRGSKEANRKKMKTMLKSVWVFSRKDFVLAYIKYAEKESSASSDNMIQLQSCPNNG